MNNDLISRQAAIDGLNEYFARIGKTKRRGLTMREKAISLDAVETIKTLPSAQPEQHWIPCSEILPKNEEYVWAVYKNSLFPNGKSHHKTLKYDGEIWIDENGYRYLTANVTHWKYRDPLPEPYKEEE